MIWRRNGFPGDGTADYPVALLEWMGADKVVMSDAGAGQNELVRFTRTRPHPDEASRAG